MQKKLLYAAAVLFIAAFAMSNMSSEETEPVTLRVLSFTSQFQNIMDRFMEQYPDINVVLEEVPWEAYVARLKTLNDTPESFPDLVFLESYFIKEFVEGDLFADLKNAPYNARTGEIFPYMVALASDSAGAVKAMGWQATPGGFFYRRSLAVQYLGTDDPKKIGKMLSSLEDFLYTAVLLDQKSGGKVKILPGYTDFMYYALALGKEPLVTKNKEFVINSSIRNYFQIAKTLYDKKLIAGVSMWSPEWFSGMQEKEASIFGFTFPWWGFHYIIKSQAPDTNGDWGLASGPSSYYWGGTWIAMTRQTKHKKEAWEFIKFLTLDHETLAWYAEQSGDFISNSAAAEKIKQNEKFKDAFLGGQNYYAFFAAEAPKVKADLVTKYDGKITEFLQAALTEYIEGRLSKEEAFAKLKQDVKEYFPELTVE